MRQKTTGLFGFKTTICFLTLIIVKGTLANIPEKSRPESCNPVDNEFFDTSTLKCTKCSTDFPPSLSPTKDGTSIF